MEKITRGDLLIPSICAVNRTIPSPHFSQGKLLFGEGEEDRRKTMRIVAPKALIAIWL
jgi:hypothetical protein